MGHPAISVKLFLTWTAGVLAYGLVCAGPPDTMMATRRDCALVFDTDGGADMYRDVCCRVRGRTWHTLRVPRTWHAWRGWSMRYTWRIWRTRRAWHAWAPTSRTWGRFGFPIAVHLKT